MLDQIIKLFQLGTQLVGQNKKSRQEFLDEIVEPTYVQFRDVAADYLDFFRRVNRALEYESNLDSVLAELKEHRERHRNSRIELRAASEAILNCYGLKQLIDEDPSDEEPLVTERLSLDFLIHRGETKAIDAAFFASVARFFSSDVVNYKDVWKLPSFPKQGLAKIPRTFSEDVIELFAFLACQEQHFAGSNDIQTQSRELQFFIVKIIKKLEKSLSEVSAAYAYMRALDKIS